MAVTRAIELGSMVGAQVTALIEAEIEGAEKAAEYIENVGFEADGNGRLQLKSVAFEMRRRDADGEVRSHVIRVPVLTLVPIPLLTIEEANLVFDLQVEDILSTEAKPEERDTTTRGRLGRLIDKRTRSKLVTRLARTNRQDTTTRADLKMTVKITQSAFPTGIERLLQAADLSVEDETL